MAFWEKQLFLWKTSQVIHFCKSVSQFYEYFMYFDLKLKKNNKKIHGFHHSDVLSDRTDVTTLFSVALFFPD